MFDIVAVTVAVCPGRRVLSDASNEVTVTVPVDPEPVPGAVGPVQPVTITTLRTTMTCLALRTGHHLDR